MDVEKGLRGGEHRVGVPLEVVEIANAAKDARLAVVLLEFLGDDLAEIEGFLLAYLAGEGGDSARAG